jgi:hypothetical protein
VTIHPHQRLQYTLTLLVVIYHATNYKIDRLTIRLKQQQQQRQKQLYQGVQTKSDQSLSDMVEGLVLGFRLALSSIGSFVTSSSPKTAHQQQQHLECSQQESQSLLLSDDNKYHIEQEEITSDLEIESNINLRHRQHRFKIYRPHG